MLAGTGIYCFLVSIRVRRFKSEAVGLDIGICAFQMPSPASKGKTILSAINDLLDG